MKIGFIGLGNVGAKLAGSVLRNHGALVVNDLDRAQAEPLLAKGATWAGSPGEMTAACDIVITSLPSPAASAEVVEHGILPAMGPGKTWIEMSTTDAGDMARLAGLVAEAGGRAAECPVSGGCHRAATANISIFAGCDRPTFEAILPVLTMMGRRILHTGPIGTASTLKVMTNYLATANLLTCCEALLTMKAAGMDLGVTYEAMAISSGTSFVHETESQVILNGSRSVDFTLDLVKKDIGLFHKIAEEAGLPLEISPLMIDMVDRAIAALGPRAQSDRMIELLEQATGLEVRADGFPAELVDDEPEEPGYEVHPRGRA